MDTKAKRRLRFGWLAVLVLASLPLGAAHAVEMVAGNTARAVAGGAPSTAISDRRVAEFPPPATPEASDQTKDAEPSPTEAAGGGAAGLEQVPRWKTLLPGALR